jgi:hypothetical protein
MKMPGISLLLAIILLNLSFLYIWFRAQDDWILGVPVWLSLFCVLAISTVITLIRLSKWKKSGAIWQAGFVLLICLLFFETLAVMLVTGTPDGSTP